MNMIEKVTRALAHANRYLWDELTQADKNTYRSEAKAAIKSMMGPTAEMVFAFDSTAKIHIEHGEDSYVLNTADAYTAMIRAALDEGDCDE